MSCYKRKAQENSTGEAANKKIASENCQKTEQPKVYLCLRCMQSALEPKGWRTCGNFEWVDCELWPEVEDFLCQNCVNVVIKRSNFKELMTYFRECQSKTFHELFQESIDYRKLLEELPPTQSHRNEACYKEEEVAVGIVLCRHH